MKKLKKILVLCLFIITLSTSTNAGVVGRGEIKLSSTAVNSFIKYIKMKDKPRVFLVPIDGSSAYSWSCPASVNCVPESHTNKLSICKKYFKKECKIFARRRVVKWANGINEGGKESKFSSKMTETEIKTKLKELGFLRAGISTSTNETNNTKKKKITKKSKKKKNNNNNNITKELKDLNELYKSGVLTKEEFEKAKKKLLN